MSGQRKGGSADGGRPLFQICAQANRCRDLHAAYLSPVAASAQDGDELAEAEAVEEIVVTGSRIKRRNLISTSPVTQVDAFEGIQIDHQFACDTHENDSELAQLVDDARSVLPSTNVSHGDTHNLSLAINAEGFFCGGSSTIPDARFTDFGLWEVADTSGCALA